MEAGQAGPDHLPLGNRRNQLQRRGGDDPQRALRTDQQLLEVEAAVVLLQRGQRREHRPVGEHRLDPEHQRAHRAVAQHLVAAGIGRNQPADGRRTLAAQRQRKAQALRGGGLVQALEHHPCLADRLPRRHVERADPVQPPQGKQQGPAAGIGRGATRHAAVATLRHHRHPVAGAQADQRRQLGGIGG
jgi:hypothetical protein